MLQGAACYQAGQREQAHALCKEALRIAPRCFEALLLLAFIALHDGDPHASIEWINQAIALNDRHADAYFLRGEAEQRLGHYQAAAASYDTVLALNPAYAEALNNRGNVHLSLGLLERALESFARAIALKPVQASFHNNQGLAFKALGQHDRAIACFERTLDLQHDYGLAYFNRGLSLFAVGKFAEAAASHAKALSVMPDHAASHWGLADALRALGEYEAALASYDRALSLDPGNADVLNNRGLALHYSGAHALALADYDAALHLNPHHADAFCNRGMALDALGRHHDALTAYDAALALTPEHAVAQFNRALCHLTLGNYEDGWRAYESRWKTEQLRTSRLRCVQPLWTGKEALHGKRILLHAEQGLGDSLQFCRYIPLVSALGAQVFVQVQAPLVSLLQQMDGVAQVIAQGEPLPAFDLHCPLMSLPLAFGTTLDSIPRPSRYLSPSQALSDVWAEPLGPRGLPRVGLVWAGAPHVSCAVQRPVDQRRSIPLEKFAALRGLDAQFYSLQKGAAAVAQLRALESGKWGGPPLVDLTASLNDFEDTAALIDQLDLVISVDTSVAHLAGALGKSVWLLNRFDTCWRWLNAGDHSPWYPSMQIFRQRAAGEWDDVIARVYAQLQRFVADA
ncbi:tetratricopeptide repeat protein [Paraburkholderia sp. DHOC27]|nr:tetratricopeptide repeat protein [Paraburkholderia sp. DHOC27]